jgi:hypothetical protein
VEDFILNRMVQLGWTYVFGPELVRSHNSVLLETVLTEALCLLNQEIAADPDRAEEVIYKLRALIQGAGGEGLVRANDPLAFGSARPPSPDALDDLPHLAASRVHTPEPRKRPRASYIRFEASLPS